MQISPKELYEMMGLCVDGNRDTDNKINDLLQLIDKKEEQLRNVENTIDIRNNQLVALNEELTKVKAELEFYKPNNNARENPIKDRELIIDIGPVRAVPRTEWRPGQPRESTPLQGPVEGQEKAAKPSVIKGLGDL